MEKLPDAGFIAERIFDIISCNDETSRICSADSASSVEALSADGDNGCHRKGEPGIDPLRTENIIVVIPFHISRPTPLDTK